jgi:hypothetical protein
MLSDLLRLVGKTLLLVSVIVGAWAVVFLVAWFTWWFLTW